jgi:exodeoxyribonuclease V alpha subunit
MSESLKNGLKGVNADLQKSPIYAKLKDLEGMTIHRLLKYSRSDNGFSYNAENQFPEKSIFVIDEASMVDVNLFSSLLQAIPSQDNDDLVTRLFILGDPYQLPSVDAGAVLGNILSSASKASYTAELKISMRFPPESKIGQLADAIKKCAVAEEKVAPNVTFVPHPVFSEKETADSSSDVSTDAVFYYTLPESAKKKEEQENVSKFLKKWIGDFDQLPGKAAEIDPEALENPSKELNDKCNDLWNKTLEKRILAAERRGAMGVEQINETIGNLIKGQTSEKKLESNSRYFEGQLLILTQNQAMYRLYNGDTGIVLFKDSVPYIMLKKPNGKTGAEERNFVAYPLSLLPADAVESAFAITIHKSQGSEYDHVTMFLPKDEGHPLLNNQIVYTGITRAKKTVTIIATPKTFKSACETVIERDTGIEL